MKGARASQNGSLVNSTDVTDPATGTAAINIPIDVVSSIHVLSTPYDPEYGKFTGAVSNVETRFGDFNKFRLSALKHLHRQTRRRRGVAPLAAVFSRAYTEMPSGRWTVLRDVNGWRRLDSFNIRNIACSGHGKRLHSTLELSELSRHSRRATLLRLTRC
jgi:hypothetical protein